MKDYNKRTVIIAIIAIVISVGSLLVTAYRQGYEDATKHHTQLLWGR